MTEDHQLATEMDFTGPFTIDEVIELEAMTGRPVSELHEGKRGEAIRAVAYIVGRRNNPNLTLADVGQLWVKLDG